MNVPRYAIGFPESRRPFMATAESCTAGLIASLLAEVPGSGACLHVGFMVYPPSGKSGFLGVRPETIKSFGLTGEEAAREMAEGVFSHEACIADVTFQTRASPGHLPTAIPFHPGPSASHGLIEGEAEFIPSAKPGCLTAIETEFDTLPRSMRSAASRITSIAR